MLLLPLSLLENTCQTWSCSNNNSIPVSQNPSRTFKIIVIQVIKVIIMIINNNQKTVDDGDKNHVANTMRTLHTHIYIYVYLDLYICIYISICMYVYIYTHIYLIMFPQCNWFLRSKILGQKHSRNDEHRQEASGNNDDSVATSVTNMRKYPSRTEMHMIPSGNLT